MGMTRQGFHKRKKFQERQNVLLDFLAKQIKEVRKNHKIMGLRKIFYKQTLSKFMGLNQFERTFKALGYGVPESKGFIRTTNSRYTERYYDNLINGLVVNERNQLIVGDITYYIVKETTYYICFLVDVYSLRIVGHSVDLNMKTALCSKAFRMVLELRGEGKMNGTIHHTDRGSQYGSLIYTELVEGRNMIISMAENCLENGYAERINGIIKQEYLDGYSIPNLQGMKQRLDKSVSLYNHERPIKRLGYISPVESEEGLAPKTTAKHQIKLYDFTVMANGFTKA